MTRFRFGVRDEVFVLERVTKVFFWGAREKKFFWGTRDGITLWDARRTFVLERAAQILFFALT